jgi:hypothetical protein
MRRLGEAPGGEITVALTPQEYRAMQLALDQATTTDPAITRLAFEPAPRAQREGHVLVDPCDRAPTTTSSRRRR